MPILRVLSTAAFEPSEIEALTQAFETVCRGLKFGQTDVPLRETVARKIIECAEAGERDPERICDHVLVIWNASSPHYNAALGSKESAHDERRRERQTDQTAGS